MKLTWLLMGLTAAAAAIVSCSSTGGTPDGGKGTGGKTGTGGVIIGEIGGRGMGGAAGTGGVIIGEIGGQGMGGAPDAGGDGRDGGGTCATAVAQGACSSEGTVCSNGCTSICQFCNQLRCTGGRWERQEVAPAGCFACGPSLLCQTNAEFCRVLVGGAVGNPPSYQCRATPAACRPTPICLCLRNQGVAETLCTEGDAGTGQITTTLLAP